MEQMRRYGDVRAIWGLFIRGHCEDRRAYVLVNNRSEGNAPLTVQGRSARQRAHRFDRSASVGKDPEDVGGVKDRSQCKSLAPTPIPPALTEILLPGFAFRVGTISFTM